LLSNVLQLPDDVKNGRRFDVFVGEDVTTFLAPDAAGARLWAGKIAGLIHRNRGARTAVRVQEKAQRKEAKRERKAVRLISRLTSAFFSLLSQFLFSVFLLLLARTPRLTTRSTLTSSIGLRSTLTSASSRRPRGRRPRRRAWATSRSRAGG
jgi:hypothetical protein